MAKKERPPLFTIRADAKLWDDLDTLQFSEGVPIRSRSDIARELIAQAAERARKSAERKRHG